jgi:hypothetical protein
LRTPLGAVSEWHNYKAVATDQGLLADFCNNSALLQQVNGYPLSDPLICLGDGHDEVWNLIGGMATAEIRLEILDWYHLKTYKEDFAMLVTALSQRSKSLH